MRAALCKMGDLKLELNKAQLLVKKMNELYRAAKDLVTIIERIGIENGGAVNADDIEDSLLEVRCCLSEIDKYRAKLQ